MSLLSRLREEQRIAVQKQYTALQTRLVQAMTWYESCANEKFSGRQIAERLERVLTQTDTPEWETDS